MEEMHLPVRHVSGTGRPSFLLQVTTLGLVKAVPSEFLHCRVILSPLKYFGSKLSPTEEHRNPQFLYVQDCPPGGDLHR